MTTTRSDRTAAPAQPPVAEATPPRPGTPAADSPLDPHAWPALWALVIGFFMILVDSTIVTTAMPAIMRGLGADINAVIWVTSAYLLAYAVPLLITGRLGDRFGPKNIYLVGLAVFTLASAWCGFSGDVSMLIAARVLQGLGAALMTPQTMSVITRMFPVVHRGAAMGLWGATAGIATLVGPILGGLLVDSLGWEWIFFVNVPVGVVGFVLAWMLVPSLPTHSHRFDWLGVLLSAVGMFALVFGLQEGETYDWGTITGPISVWGLIITGVVVLVAFVLWQRYNRGEPLIPLRLFRDRNFSLANTAITLVGLAITAMNFPIMLFLQTVRGLTPTQAALMLAPMAVVSGAMAPVVGRIIARVDPRRLAVPGMAAFGVGLLILAAIMTPDTPLVFLALVPIIMGLGSSCMWAPLSISATRNLTPDVAGAGSGVYNTTRQVGAVLGSAAIAVLIQSRLTAELPQLPGGAPAGEAGASAAGALPTALQAGYAGAMGQSLVLPAVALLVAALVAAFLATPRGLGRRRGRHAA
ncbi:MFS transporter [Tersicoccus solisilvae]|uniref:MFS transporter n=2 Tax=Tersicoccus solisilvae TaxID=1882339 RepID=A0ABQ1NW51_9MICC|nr:DHA2 family efflux MFS transporter permease subunit [Tersicoccus solisilvae]GGC86316.1 MFS transporter [Tersicoccus solisilvae]